MKKILFSLITFFAFYIYSSAQEAIQPTKGFPIDELSPPSQACVITIINETSAEVKCWGSGTVCVSAYDCLK